MIAWHHDPEPPLPQGVVGVGACSRRLLDVVEGIAPADRAGLLATANADVLILTGAATRLPWCDGVEYIAPRAEAPALWLPTNQRPVIALDLLERALRRQHPQQPLLMLRAPPQLLPLTRLAPLTAELLQAFRQRWQDG